jgi:DNA-binding XRE family transcriptional regulator
MLLGEVMSWNQKKRGRFVRGVRERMQLTQYQLARKLDISPTRLGRIERGQVDMWLSEFSELCLLVGTWNHSSPRNKRPNAG